MRGERLRLGAVGELDQYVPGMRLAECIARPRNVPEHQVDADARDQLEAGDAIADRAAQAREERQRRARALERDERGRKRARLGEELEHRGGDDAERALCADEEVLEVVPGVVLA